MKKSLAISLIIILIIGGILVGMPSKVYAYSVSMSPSSRTVTVDDTVSATVYFGRGLSAAQFSMSHSSNLTFVSKSIGDYTGGQFGFFGQNDSVSSVTFTFKANEVGTGRISVSGAIITYGDTYDEPAGSTSTTITINPKATPTPTPEPTPTPTPRPTEAPSNPNTTEPPTPTSTPEPNNPNDNQEPDNQEPDNQEENNVDDNNQDENNNNEQNNNETAPDEILKIDREDDVVTVKNEENDIMVKGIPLAIKETDVNLDVQLINEDSDRMKALDNIMKKIKGNKKYYDIKLLKDNEIIQPNGYVTVYIPIPEEYNKDKLELYFINEETKKYEKKNGEIQGNYYTFTTNHFSVYSLVEKTEEENQGISITNVIFMILAGILLVAIVAILIQRNNKEDI